MKKVNLLLLLLFSTLALTAQHGQKVTYVCPPCGCEHDGELFEESGTCASCSMTLVDSRYDFAKMREIARKNRKQVAILVFPGVQIIDYTGPYEVFGQAGFNVFLVAEADTMFRTAMGMQVVPHYTLADHPKADVIVIPGGGVTRAKNSKAVLSWIKDTEKEAASVMSVCNGAYILANTGLLDGKKATTFASLIPGLRKAAPKTEVVEDMRFVDNGKIITTAGLSSGLDGSLHLVAKMLGLGRAQMIATNLEYDWDVEGNYVRAALADQKVDDIFDEIKIAYPERKITVYEGDEDQWTIKWAVEAGQQPAELVARFNAEISRKTAWKHKDSKKGENGSTSKWFFTDEESKPWVLYVQVEQKTEEELEITYHLERTKGSGKKVRNK
ncbi:MAG: DJ-1/PfpI family protein [Saprospiraceae bacterium]|nr:DJ-1/PfpI family protein [Saprospiraceae bacterium]